MFPPYMYIRKLVLCLNQCWYLFCLTLNRNSMFLSVRQLMKKHLMFTRYLYITIQNKNLDFLL